MLNPLQAVKIDDSLEIPLYQQVARGIRDLIQSGALEPGDRLPSTYELSQAYGVSTLTVDNAINLLVKEGLIRRRPRRGSFVCKPESPVQTSRPVQSTRVGSVRIVFTGISASDYFGLGLLQAVEEECRIRNFDTLFSQISQGCEGETDYQQLVANADALLVCGSADEYTLNQIKDSGRPFVLIGDVRDASIDITDVDIVAHDERERAYLSTKHLLDLGHRHIMIVIPGLNNQFGRDLLAGYQQAMADAGAEVTNEMIIEDDSFMNGGQRVGSRILKRRQRPTAVLVWDDRMAVSMIRRLREKGVSVPDDISVVGRGNMEIGQLIEPPLTTSPLLYAQQARLACEKLMAQLSGKHQQRQRTLVPVKQMVIRKSTAPVNIRST